MRLQTFIYFLIICCLNIFLIRATPIELSFSQSNAYVSATNSTPIRVQLKAKIHDVSPTEAKEPPPCELTVVLDRSGSMVGDKIEKSKESIKNIILGMKKNDRINIIVYNPTADLLVENGGLENKDEIFEKIDRVVADDGTNLYSGLELGIEVAKGKNKASSVNNKRIFLFSDGLANIGKTSPKEIMDLVAKSEIQISAFGVGSDFDKVLMPQIAGEGHGEFFFIDSAESIEKFVGITSRGFMDLMGVDAEFRTFCPPGVELVKVFGRDGKNGRFRVGDLRKNDTLHYFLEFTTDPKLFVKEDMECDYVMTFKDVLTNKEEILKGTFMKIQVTNDENKVNETDMEVEKIFEVQKIIENQEVVQKFLEKGDMDSVARMFAAEIPKIEKLEEEIKDEDNQKMTETARKRLEYLKKKTERNPHDTTGNIEQSKQTLYLTSSYSKRYDDL